MSNVKGIQLNIHIDGHIKNRTHRETGGRSKIIDGIVRHDHHGVEWIGKLEVNPLTLASPKSMSLISASASLLVSNRFSGFKSPTEARYIAVIAAGNLGKGKGGGGRRGRLTVNDSPAVHMCNS